VSSEVDWTIFISTRERDEEADERAGCAWSFISLLKLQMLMVSTF